MLKRLRPTTSGVRVAGNPVEARSLEKLYEEHVSAVYRFVYARVGNREEAEDITSQIFVKAIHNIDTEREQQSIQSWLFQVARTTLADHWREFYRAHVTSLDDMVLAGWEIPELDHRQSSETATDRVDFILSRLPTRYREVLTLRFLMQSSVHETAESMHLSEANVKVLQFRALKKASEIIVGSQVSDPGMKHQGAESR